MLDNYRQLSLFDEFVDNEDDANFVAEDSGYELYQDEKSDGKFEYKVFDDDGILVAKWVNSDNALDMSTSELKRSKIFHVFTQIIRQEADKKAKAAAAERAKANRAKAEINKVINTSKNNSYIVDTDDKTPWWRMSNTSSYRAPSYTYQPPKKSTGFLDKLNKSDTLVIHCADRSTDMLSQIYQGKGWDVLRDGNIDKEELHQLLESHDKIICLGHGTAGGLINIQGGGNVIGPDEAPYLKNKKLFVIWCNADAYFKRHGIGNGQFITGNMPSEVWECRAAGCGNISSELMLENITYWSKLCADVVERALSGDAQGAVNYVRDKYIEKYGDHPVTIYNAERTKVQGKPLEDLSHRYWGPEELLKPQTPVYKTFYSSPIDDFTDEDDEEESEYNELGIDTRTGKPWGEFKHVDEPEEEYFEDDLEDEIHGLYVLNPAIQDDIEAEGLSEYIDEIEDMLVNEFEEDDIKYWMDIVKNNDFGILVHLFDGKEYKFKIEDGKLIPWD